MGNYHIIIVLIIIMVMGNNNNGNNNNNSRGCWGCRGLGFVKGFRVVGVQGLRGLGV